MTYDVIDRARRRTRRRVTAAALVTAAVTAGVAGGVLVQGGHATRPPTTAAVTAPVEAAGQARMPADLRWVPVAGVSIPVSELAGPSEASGGIARGFSHDEPGAVLAAVHVVIRLAPQLGPAVFDATVREQVVGPDAAALRSRIGQDYDNLRANAGVAYGQPVGRLDAALRGYRLTGYSPQEASVQILTEAAAGTGQPVLVATTVQMRWTGSDWALVAPAGGDFNAVVAVADSASYHPFTLGR